MNTNIHHLNYYLLTLFHTLYQTRSVSLTAEKLSVTQSTISNGLGRLRIIFHDQLFYRKDNVMMPTNRSISLFPLTTQILKKYEQLSFYGQPFDPKLVPSHFRIGMSPILQDLIYTDLLNVVANYKVTLDVDVLTTLKNSTLVPWQEYDFVLTSLPLPTDYQRVLLFEDELIVIMNKNHPLTNKSKLNIDEYGKAIHVCTSSFQNEGGKLTTILNKHQITRKILTTTDNFATIYRLITEQNCLLTITNSLYQMYKKLFFINLKTLKLDISEDMISYYLYYSERATMEPEGDWFKNKILTLVSDKLKHS